MKNPNHKNNIIKVLKSLAQDYPQQDLASHIGIATADYTNISAIDDKELHFLLDKYKTEKDLDIAPQISQEDSFTYVLLDGDDDDDDDDDDV